MVGYLIPGLTSAWADGGESEPTNFGELIIPQNFKSVFKFKDNDKTWTAIFHIRITELGTPKLMGIELVGSRAKHPKPIERRYTGADLDRLARDSTSESGAYLPGIVITKAEAEEYERLNPEPESIERWQLRFIEQHRFQLFELGIQLALQLGKPDFKKFPDGTVHRVYVHQEIEEIGLKKLQKEIVKKIRQKITPELLAEVAKIYSEAALKGDRPIKAVMEFYKCSSRTAQDYATKARGLNLLPKTTPGKVTVKKTRVRKEKNARKTKK